MPALNSAAFVNYLLAFCLLVCTIIISADPTSAVPLQQVDPVLPSDDSSSSSSSADSLKDPEFNIYSESDLTPTSSLESLLSLHDWTQPQPTWAETTFASFRQKSVNDESPSKIQETGMIYFDRLHVYSTVATVFNTYKISDTLTVTEWEVPVYARVTGSFSVLPEFIVRKTLQSQYGVNISTPEEQRIFSERYSYLNKRGLHGKFPVFEFDVDSDVLFKDSLAPYIGRNANNHTFFSLDARVSVIDNGNETSFYVQSKEGSSRTGIVQTRFLLNTTTDPVDGYLPFCGANGAGDDACAKIHFVRPENGWSIITDIDDTIKVSEILDTRKTITNALTKPYEPVPFFPEVIQNWMKQLNSPSMHYVSGSWLPLYKILDDWLVQDGLPQGSMHLKPFAVWDMSLLKSLGHGKSIHTKQHKLDTIQTLMTRITMNGVGNKKFLLIGDSTELDAEVYAEIATTFPNHVGCIFIRNVTGVAPEKELELNSPERFAKIFADVDAKKWFVFSDMRELLKIRVAKGECWPREDTPEEVEEGRTDKDSNTRTPKSRLWKRILENISSAFEKIKKWFGKMFY